MRIRKRQNVNVDYVARYVYAFYFVQACVIDVNRTAAT